MLAEIITIGDEILIGQVVDTNSAWMGTKLNEIGVRVQQITSVSDDADHITAALQEAEKRANIILVTGGLGPTKDDITKHTLARYFNMGLRRDEDTLRHIQQIFNRSNRPMIESNIRQADVPDGCTVILNKNGTAPCMWFEKEGANQETKRIIVSMPGVPFEMKYLMEEEILPRLKVLFNLSTIIHQTILTANIGESFLAQEIEQIEDSLPSYIKLAYLPKLGQVRLRLSGTGTDELLLRKEINSFSDLIVRKIKQYVVATEDIALEQAVLALMKSKGLSLSTAESCTGGKIAQLITQHPGCSEVYKGGAVVYSNALKESVLGVKHETLLAYGAVSEATAIEMAKGAVEHFKTDIAVAVTGIAGPNGGTSEKPVGTVWIAVASRQTVTSRLFNYGSKRTQNIERSASAALSMVLSLIRETF